MRYHSLHRAALLIALACGAAFPPAIRAAAPSWLNYQGRVAVDGVNFNGAGEFKFAVLDDGGATLWCNDGTVAAGEPAKAIVIPVDAGLYSLLLGDTSLPNMAALPPAVFSGVSSDLRLRVWFRHSASAPFQQLAPDTRLASSAFSLHAKTIDAGVFTSGLNGSGLFGTSDATPLTLQVNGQAVARFGLGGGQALAFGHGANSISVFATGATISGGGSAANPHSVLGIYGTVGGGLANTVNAGYATIGGGQNHIANGERSVIAGGTSNTTGGFNSVVSGGNNNSAGGGNAVVAGGSSNSASGSIATIGGGIGNTASGSAATIPGGTSNTASGANSLAAGRRAKAAHAGSFVWADDTDAEFASTAPNQFCIRASGGIRLANGTRFIGGLDLSQTYLWTASTSPILFYSDGEIIGQLGLEQGTSLTWGYRNTIAPGLDSSTISGGRNNWIEGRLATVAGGTHHHITSLGEWGTISGGTSHILDGWCGTIGGGNSNKAGGNATVAGGIGNYATGGASAIPGGMFNAATESGTFAAGRNAVAKHEGAWVWSCDWQSNFESTATNQFLIRAYNGVGVNTNAPGATLHVNGTAKIQGVNNWDVTNTEGDFRVGNDTQRFKIGIATSGGGAGDVWMRAHGGTQRLIQKAPGGFLLFTNEANTAGVSLAAGAGSWTNVSDRHAKENFAPVDALAVLAKVAALPLSTWNYRAQDAAIRHVGPMAQDFRAAFGLGESDTGISTVDADGIALAAIQGVNQKLEREVKELRAELAELRATVAKLGTTR